MPRTLVPVLQADRGAWLQRLLHRRAGPLGLPLLLVTYVLLGVALVLYVVAMLALAFAAVLLHTSRLLFGPLLGALRRAVLPRAAA